jgi:hypothetical protein
MSKKKQKIQELIPSSNTPKKRVNGIKKGKQYEREVANDIGHIFPEAQRNLEYQASDEQGLDIKGTDRIKIQCKFRQNYVPINTIREIQLKNKDEIPVLVTKGNHREPMAVLPWKKLVTLLEIAYGLELPFPLPESEIHNPRSLLKGLTPLPEVSWSKEFIMEEKNSYMEDIPYIEVTKVSDIEDFI